MKYPVEAIEYVLMDFEGNPVTIEDGTRWYWCPEDGEHWNSTTLQFEPDEDTDEDSDDDFDDEPDWDRIPYGWKDNFKYFSEFDKDRFDSWCER